MAKKMLLLAACILAAGGVDMALAADGCDGFRWDIGKERALFAGKATAQKAAAAAGAAPHLDIARLYELQLTSQDQVAFAIPPGKKMLADGAFGGVATFKVPASGFYRVALDVPFWIDVVDDGSIVAAKDFGGPQNCAIPPHKLVEFELTGGKQYLLQFSGQTNQTVHVSVTSSAAGKS